MLLNLHAFVFGRSQLSYKGFNILLTIKTTNVYFKYTNVLMNDIII